MSVVSDEMSGQDGGTIQRLTRVESKVDTLETKLDGMTETLDGMADKVLCLSQAEDRRFADRQIPDRVRKLEDQMLIWDTRWQTISTMLSRVFGVSIIAAVASVLSIIAVLSELFGAPR
jgi:hypothetical protein